MLKKHLLAFFKGVRCSAENFADPPLPVLVLRVACGGQNRRGRPLFLPFSTTSAMGVLVT